MSKKRRNLKIGDSVVVKPGVKDPDTGGDISGWQGRVSDFDEYEGEPTVMIVWDSVTLKNMPLSVVEFSEEKGLDWRVMGLSVNDVDLTSARDTEKDVEKALAEIDQHMRWLGPDEEDKRIQKVLDGIAPHDTTKQFRAWKKYLREKLKFPFEAEVHEYQDRGPLRAGDRVNVKGISLVDDHYGIIVELMVGRRRYDFPLCDLEVTDQQSANYQPVKDYAIWFANR